MTLRTYLEPLFGLLGDAAFGGEQRWSRRRDCDLRGEFGGCGGDEQLGHVGRDSGADPACVSLLRLIRAFCTRKERKKKKTLVMKIKFK